MTLRFLTYAPAHFHAALVHKEAYPGVDDTVHIYGPLVPDLATHLQRLADYNRRAEDPTSWKVELHAGPNGLERLIREKPGNVLVLAGNNRRKIDAIEAGVAAGLHVLADKPWILVPEDLPRLAQVLQAARARGTIAYDIMTERYEITSMLQRALIARRDLVGPVLPGNAAEPAVHMESIHYLKKTVSGQPLRRPPVFFDVDEQGEGLNDVGTHLVDLAMWLLFPDQPIEAATDVRIVAARRWATLLPRLVFGQITGTEEFPAFLRPQVEEDVLHYPCNTQVDYTLRGHHVRLDVLWDVEALPGAGDSHQAVVRCEKADIAVRQGPKEHYRPEIYLVPKGAGAAADLRAALPDPAELWGCVPEETADGEWRFHIPEALRVGHEAHFAQVTRQFLSYLRGEESLPDWEDAVMQAKYLVTTEGTALARRTSA